MSVRVRAVAFITLGQLYIVSYKIDIFVITIKVHSKLHPFQMSNWYEIFHTVISVHDPFTTTSSEEAFLHYFLVILKQPLQNYYKIMKKYLLCIRTVMLNLQTHHGVWPITKRSNNMYLVWIFSNLCSAVSSTHMQLTSSGFI